MGAMRDPEGTASTPDDGTTRHRPPGHRARESAADSEVRARHAEYWRRNLRYLVGLLSVWFLVSYGFGIILAGPLNQLTLPGTGLPLGFWFAQQGSIYTFVVLIFVYVVLMNRLDREFDVDEGGQ
jgi:putative solute:sodium symporter small subunit